MSTQREKFIYKFDDKGNFLTSLGSQGQGPGELQFPTSFAINRWDELVLIDWSARELKILDNEGVFKKGIKLRSDIYAVFPLQDKKYLITKSLTSILEAAEAQILAFILCDSELDEIKEIYRIKNPHLDKLERINGLGEHGLVQVSSSWIYFGNANEEYEILAFDIGGNLIRKIRKDYNSVPVTEDIKKQYNEARWNRLPTEVREKVFFPKNMPPFQGGFTDDEERLYVMTFEKEANSGKYIYDVFNPEGVFLDRTVLDNFGEKGVSTSPLLVMAKGGRLYYFRVKESGYKELVVYQMNWE